MILYLGAVFGSVPHIVQIDDYMDTLAFKPESNYVLTFRNEDRPGALFYWLLCHIYIFYHCIYFLFWASPYFSCE
jgi:hypothetical protein